MDWLIGLLLLVVGAIIGFFVAKYFSQADSAASDRTENEQTVKEIMLQQAHSHLLETKKVAELLNQQSAALSEQISAYEQLVISHNTGDEDNKLNYFGEHTSAYLRNKSTSSSREKSNAEVQPLDFASESSGLFSGSEESKTEKNS